MGGQYTKEALDNAEEMTRDKVIEFLVDFEEMRILGNLNQQNFEPLEDMIRNGIAGFANLTNEELIEEYDNCYNMPIKIWENTENTMLEQYIKDGIKSGHSGSIPASKD